ncbi:hypothetical protein OJAV_G00061260 [Oryzias javanicus]|uniref:Uncharacterized protein n=1 Tax=Oryzias javanicus TaxID=123683 RepID=A0A3S2P9V5_ORYJA|nr:hypothetical protein OJAV_G00061260 [Oryzias javanicus]
MQRPGREYWAVPPQRMKLRTSPTMTGPDAIILRCLRRTPDQTITPSGSPPPQTEPRGSDSTDKRASGRPGRRGERGQGSSKFNRTAFFKLASFGSLNQTVPLLQRLLSGTPDGNSSLPLRFTLAL